MKNHPLMFTDCLILEKNRNLTLTKWGDFCKLVGIIWGDFGVNF